MNRRVLLILVIAAACLAAALSMYVVRLDANALRELTGKLGATVSFTGARPSMRGAQFRDAIFRRSGAFDLYLVVPSLQAARRDDTWTMLAEEGNVHAFGSSFSLPSGIVRRAEFTFGHGQIAFDGAVAAPFFMIDTPQVHDRPLIWKDLVFTASGHVDEATAMLTLDSGSAQKDGASVDVSGSWRVGFSARPVRLEFHARGVRGEEVRKLLPEVLTTRLGDVRFGGEIGFSLVIHAGESPSEPVRVALDLDNRLTVKGLGEGCNLQPLATRFLWDEYDSSGGSIGHESGPTSAGWCPPESIPSAFTETVIAITDPLFPVHRGTSPRIVAGLLEDAINGTPHENESATVTERFAATLWPLPGSGLRRRVELAILAVHLEQSLNKQSILAHFANTADFGHGVRGLREAARHFFAKPAEDLTVCESVLLAMIAASPSEPVVDNQGHALPTAARAAQAQLDDLLRRGLVTQEQHRSALAELRLESAPQG